MRTVRWAGDSDRKYIRRCTYRATAHLQGIDVPDKVVVALEGGDALDGQQVKCCL